MVILDISVPLRKGMHIYPGDAPFYVTPHKTLAKDGERIAKTYSRRPGGEGIDQNSLLSVAALD
mgnify:CR=1 FL=1